MNVNFIYENQKFTKIFMMIMTIFFSFQLYSVLINLVQKLSKLSFLAWSTGFQIKVVGKIEQTNIELYKTKIDDHVTLES